MKYLPFIYGIIAAAILYGCSNNASREETLINREIPVCKVDIAGEDVGAACRHIKDSTIYFSLNNEDYLIGQIKPHDSGNYSVQKICRRGQGPDELIYCYSILNNRNELLLYNNMQRKALLFNLNCADAVTTPVRLDAFDNIPKKYPVGNITFLNDSTVLGQVLNYGEDDSPREAIWFYSINIDNGNVKPIKGYDINDGADVPLRTKQIMYYNSNLCVNPMQSKVAVSFGDVGQYLEIFEINGDSIVNRNILLNVFQKYTKEDGSMNPKYLNDPDCPLGMDLKASDDYIFAFPSRTTRGELITQFSGEIIDKFEGPAKGISYKDEVWVYDWNGKIVDKLKLTPMIEGIAVTSDSKYIYGVSEDENYQPILMRFETGL